MSSYVTSSRAKIQSKRKRSKGEVEQHKTRSGLKAILSDCIRFRLPLSKHLSQLSTPSILPRLPPRAGAEQGSPHQPAFLPEGRGPRPTPRSRGGRAGVGAWGCGTRSRAPPPLPARLTWWCRTPCPLSCRRPRGEARRSAGGAASPTAAAAHPARPTAPGWRLPQPDASPTLPRGPPGTAPGRRRRPHLLPQVVALGGLGLRRRPVLLLPLQPPVEGAQRARTRRRAGGRRSNGGGGRVSSRRRPEPATPAPAAAAAAARPQGRAAGSPQGPRRGGHGFGRAPPAHARSLCPRSRPARPPAPCAQARRCPFPPRPPTFRRPRRVIG